MTLTSCKEKLLEQLYLLSLNCKNCPLAAQRRTRIIFGEGNPNARLIIIGEGPGKKESEQGRPFIGRSGKLLSHSLKAAGIFRNETYITNIVKCRPPNNRKPLSSEIKACKKLLLSQINIIKPQIICTLGTTALESLLEKKIKISKERGSFIAFTFATIIPTYHPAYILRNPKELKTFIKDLSLVASKLQ